VAVAIGAHSLVYHRQQVPPADSPLSTAGLTTQASGSTFLLVALTIQDSNSEDGFDHVADNKSNTWTQVGTTQSFWGGGAFLRVFRCVGGTGGSNHVFSLYKTSQYPDYEATLCVVEVTGAGAVDDFEQAYCTGNPIQTSNVTTTESGDMLLILAAPEWMGENTFASGWTKLDELDDLDDAVLAVVGHKTA